LGSACIRRKQKLSIALADLNHIVLHLKSLLLRIIGEDMELKTVLASDDLVVMADAGQIEQVLMNLVTNAKDAMTGGGTITVRTESTELNNEFIKTYGFGKSGRYAPVG
jgi:two-component system NtrC family sensor kinase